MILLKPTFDVHISEMNSLKVTALAVTEKARRYLQSFFKSNDSCHQLPYERLEDFLDYCYSRRLEFFLDDNVRRGDECPQTEGRDYDSLLCHPYGEPDAAA
jgi:hypothetical protein